MTQLIDFCQQNNINNKIQNWINTLKLFSYSSNSFSQIKIYKQRLHYFFHLQKQEQYQNNRRFQSSQILDQKEKLHINKKSIEKTKQYNPQISELSQDFTGFRFSFYEPRNQIFDILKQKKKVSEYKSKTIEKREFIKDLKVKKDKINTDKTKDKDGKVNSQKMMQQILQLRNKKISFEKLVFKIQSIIHLQKQSSQQNLTEIQNLFKNPNQDKQQSVFLPQIKSSISAFLNISQINNLTKIKLYFLDSFRNFIRIQNKHQKILFINNQFKHFLMYFSQSQCIIGQNKQIKNKAMNNLQFKLNPQTGQIFLQYQVFSSSDKLPLYQILNLFLQQIYNEVQYIFKFYECITKGTIDFKGQNFAQLQKLQNLQIECKMLTKINLQANQSWLQKQIKNYKTIEKKKIQQQLLIYTFPQKIASYQIKCDPFLRDQEKKMAEDNLNTNDKRQSEYKDFKSIQKQIFKYQIFSKKDQIQNKVLYSKIFLQIKKSFHQLNTQIKKSLKNIAPKEKLIKEDEISNRKRHCSTSLPNIPYEQKRQFGRLRFGGGDLVNEENLKIIKRQIEDIKKKQKEIGTKIQGKCKIQSTVKLITHSDQKFFSFQLISVQKLEQIISINNILSQYSSQNNNIRASKGTLKHFLFDYKNHQIYSEWIQPKTSQPKQCNIQSNHSFNNNFLSVSQQNFNNSLFSVTPENSNTIIWENQKTFTFYQSLFQSSHRNNTARSMQVININLKQPLLKQTIQMYPQNQEQRSFQSQKNILKTNLFFCQFGQTPSFDDQKNLDQTKQIFINLTKISNNLIFQENKLLSIRSACRTIPLAQFLMKNSKTLNFNKKIFIFKQIIEFYYLLQYHSLSKQICFGIENIHLTRSLNIKIDCKSRKRNLCREINNSIYYQIFSLFLEMFLDRKIRHNLSRFDKDQTQRECIKQNQLFEKEKSDCLTWPINAFNKQDNQNKQNKETGIENQEYFQQKQQSYKGMRKIVEQNTFLIFSQIEMLRKYGDTEAIKLIWTLLLKYTKNVQPQENQLFYERSNLSWFYILLIKIEEILALKNFA